MELVEVVITGIVAATLMTGGITATVLVLLRDGYGARAFQSNYDTRQPL